MIFLDANSFYWYLGRDELPMDTSVPIHDIRKLNDFLDNCNDKSVPASVLMEMITFFKDSPDAIRKIVSFIMDKNIRIYSNISEHIFSQQELEFILLTVDSELKKYADEILNEKIEIESKHSYMFLQCVSTLYADFYLKSYTELNTETREKILLFLGNEMIGYSLDDYQSQLKLALKSGYACGRPKQELKNKYIDLLIQSCAVFHILIDAVVMFVEEEKEIYPVMCKSAEYVKSNGFTNADIMKTITKTLSADSGFLKLAEEEIANILQRHGYSKHQAEYMKLMFASWLERGKKIEKNDIFDMLSLRALDNHERKSSLNLLIDQGPYLISFDKPMMKYLCNNVGNVRLLNQFLLPEYLLTAK